MLDHLLKSHKKEDKQGRKKYKFNGYTVQKYLKKITLIKIHFGKIHHNQFSRQIGLF